MIQFFAVLCFVFAGIIAFLDPITLQRIILKFFGYVGVSFTAEDDCISGIYPEIFNEISPTLD